MGAKLSLPCFDTAADTIHVPPCPEVEVRVLSDGGIPEVKRTSTTADAASEVAPASHAPAHPTVSEDAVDEMDKNDEKDEKGGEGGDAVEGGEDPCASAPVAPEAAACPIVKTTTTPSAPAATTTTPPPPVSMTRKVESDVTDVADVPDVADVADVAVVAVDEAPTPQKKAPQQQAPMNTPATSSSRAALGDRTNLLSATKKSATKSVASPRVSFRTPESASAASLAAATPGASAETPEASAFRHSTLTSRTPWEKRAIAFG